MNGFFSTACRHVIRSVCVERPRLYWVAAGRIIFSPKLSFRRTPGRTSRSPTEWFRTGRSGECEPQRYRNLGRTFRPPACHIWRSLSQRSCAPQQRSYARRTDTLSLLPSHATALERQPPSPARAKMQTLPQNQARILHTAAHCGSSRRPGKPTSRSANTAGSAFSPPQQLRSKRGRVRRLRLRAESRRRNDRPS